MPGVSLLGQPYAGKSLIASGQKCINLYPEDNQPANQLNILAGGQSPVPITYYQFPGNELFGTPNAAGINRCIYRTSKGTVYTVVKGTVYLLQSNGALLPVGGIPDKASQVYMADNGLAVVIVDGSSQGWAIDMATNDFGAIIDPSFYGADQVRFLDTFFVFNRPSTNQFYISLSMVTFALLTAGTSFDPLDIAAKSGFADPIVSILVIQKNLWLIGELTTEPWIGTGAADFYFQQVQGTFINHGCIAPYSAATTDVVGFWLMQDLQGKNIIIKTNGYNIQEVSTPYLVSQFNTYETTGDAIGMILQIEDHAFYVLAFPTANITWAMELNTGYWCQLGKWNLNTETFDRYRANGCCYAFGFVLISDYSTGKIYKLNAQLATDGGENIKFVRTFTHMVGPEFQRVIYKNASINIQPGTSTIPLGDANNADGDTEPEVLLSWSDDRGKTFNTPIPQGLGRQGEYLTDPQWNRLGMARDRIFKVEWNGPVITALNGAFVEASPLRT